MFGLDDTAVGLIMSGEFNLLHQDIEGRTILFHAVSSNRVEIVRLLCSLMGGKNRHLQNLLHLKDRHGCNVFALAASLGHDECLELLLSQNQSEYNLFIRLFLHKKNWFSNNTFECHGSTPKYPNPKYPIAKNPSPKYPKSQNTQD